MEQLAIAYDVAVASWMGSVLAPEDPDQVMPEWVAGTWRRADAVMTVQPWRPLSGAERDAVAAEAEALPLPGLGGRIVIRWDG